VHNDRSLIVQTTNCVEEREWFDLLHKVCLMNSIRMQYFHPSAFVSGTYSCCGRSDENSPGCKNVSEKEMDYFQMDLVTALDPPLDLQRIHTLIMSNMSVLESLLDPLNYHQHLPQTQHQQHNPLVPLATDLQKHSPQAFAEFKRTIEKLREKAYAIDRDHRDYKQGITRQLKYGSRQAPIGDDNYWHMMRAAGQLNQQHHQQQQHQQQQQQQLQLQQFQPQPVLPQMQNVRAYPYQPATSNMNAYYLHNLQHQQQRLHMQQQQQHQPLQQQQSQFQPLRSHQLQRHNNNLNNNNCGNASSSSPSSTTSSVVAAPPSTTSSSQPAPPIY